MRQMRTRRMSGKHIVITCLVFALIVLGLSGVIKKYPELLHNQLDDLVSIPAMGLGGRAGAESDPLGLASVNAMLVRLSDHEVLMEKNADQTVYPASLTKIMTAIVALEQIEDDSVSVVFSQDMFAMLNKANAALAGFLPGEEVRAIDLLYGLLLPSGAECAVGLAEYVSGTEEDFVQLMNDKAEELGMADSHFTNTIGLHDKRHYTTVKDLSTLLSYALENERFREIFTTARYSTRPTNLHPDGITFYSTMFQSIADPSIEGGVIMGGKTGYTGQAGLCLASLAEKDGQEYILITAGADGNHYTEQFNIRDAFKVYNSQLG